MEVILYDEEMEYIVSSHSGDLGFKFLAHDPKEPPFLKELGAGLAPGFHYLVALKQSEVLNLLIFKNFNNHVLAFIRFIC